MGARSRNKGANGERELARLLSDELGLEVTRNLLQSREGGHDLDGVSGWCLEVKRRARVAEGDKRQWWEQAHQAMVDGYLDYAAVLYRQDRGNWRAIVQLGVLNIETFGCGDGYESTAEISLRAFCQLVRESLEVAHG